MMPDHLGSAVRGVSRIAYFEQEVVRGDAPVIRVRPDVDLRRAVLKALLFRLRAPGAPLHPFI